MTEDQQELYDRAMFGKQVEQFWGSQIGNYLQTRARECYTAGIRALKEVDPTDTRAVINAQNDVKVAEQFENWLTEAVIDGVKALELITGESDD